MEYRIVEYSPEEFVVQFRDLFLWYNANKYESTMCSFYRSKERAESAIQEYILHQEAEARNLERKRLRQKNAKYHYIGVK